MTVEEAKSIKTELDVVEGMQFDRGYVSPYFITNAEKMIAKLDQAYNWARAPAAIEEVANAHPISPVRGHSPATENVMLPTPAR